ncbi:MAG: Na(+)/H(+) antiporter subunit D [Candidatus Methanospirareceae archaeon]
MIEWLHPGLIFIVGALLIPFLKGKLRKAYLLLLPALAFVDLYYMSTGVFWRIPFLEYELVLGRVDKLSLVFAYIFVIAAFCMTLFALHVERGGEHVAAFLYMGGTLGVVFAGDLYTLTIFWELMAISSIFLIGFRGTKAAYSAAVRYIMMHIFGGSCLFGGVIMYVQATGSIAFNAFYPQYWGFGTEYLPSYLILTGLLLNAAVPPLHAWLPDAYPEATATGGVFLSAFTTKSAVYALLRGFPGLEILIFLGTMMTIYGIIYALLENDARRILAYSIINQVGFMVAGIGIGTPLAICGVVSHAFCHILYKGLLWMSAGSVLFVTGKTKCTDLGGLYKTMPLTCIFALVGAFSISAFPLTNGFTSKPMTIMAAANEHMGIIWLLLMVASAGVFLHAGVKYPYFVFFAKDRGLKAHDPPLNQLLGMGLVSFLCIFLGVYPQPLYNLLPYQVDFVAYTIPHVVGMLSLLSFSGLAFFMLLPILKRTETISLDTDWFYRAGARKFMWFCEGPLVNFASSVDNGLKGIASSFSSFGRNPRRATRIALSTIMVKALKTFVLEFWWRVYRYYERDLEEAKSRPLDEPIERVPLGIAVLLVLLFFILYFIIYLIYGLI